ncbi:unnamed protein product [Orchesella dallaii]|uniref:Uncharacterized protein n=1 Tax=Orchesella dallaii TaxID=48710 RepID=A0ABP1RXQ6_9HEXA
MKINSGIVLFTIALAAQSFAAPNDEILSVKGTEPDPLYQSRPIYKATPQILLLHLVPERMTEFVESFSAFYNRNDNSNEARRAERWLNERICTVLSHYKLPALNQVERGNLNEPTLKCNLDYCR